MLQQQPSWAEGKGTSAKQEVTIVTVLIMLFLM